MSRPFRQTGKNITAEEREPAVRVVRLADIRKEIKEKPAQKGDIKIKYVKMRDDDGNAEEAAKKPAVGIKKRTGKMKEQTPSLPQKAIMTIKRRRKKKIKKRRAKKRA